MMTAQQQDARAAKLVRRGFSQEMAGRISATLDTVERNGKGKWIIRDEQGKVIAVIDPV